jgi:hypothetical protein
MLLETHWPAARNSVPQPFGLWALSNDMVKPTRQRGGSRRQGPRRATGGVLHWDELVTTLGLCRFLKAHGEGFQADGNPRANSIY